MHNALRGQVNDRLRQPLVDTAGHGLILMFGEWRRGHPAWGEIPGHEAAEPFKPTRRPSDIPAGFCLAEAGVKAFFANYTQLSLLKDQ